MSTTEMQYIFFIFIIFSLTVLGIIALSRSEVSVAKLIISALSKFSDVEIFASKKPDYLEPDGNKEKKR